MKRPILVIAILCIALIFTGCVLQNWIPLSVYWKHDVGMMDFYVGLFVLLRILIKPVMERMKK